MAMAHSVEGRYPFLDHRVVEFAAKLPSNVKMKVLDQKHLLKRAFDGLDSRVDRAPSKATVSRAGWQVLFWSGRRGLCTGTTFA